MSKSPHKQVSEFELEGRFLGFISKKGDEPQALWLATAEGEYPIQLSKKSRASLSQILMPGDWIQVSGKKKLNSKNGTCKLKAAQVTVAAPKCSEPFPQPKAKLNKAKAKILICQKSACMKRGAKAVQQALEITLRERGLEEQVSIKGTGCMNCCKKGPNIVFVPDKSRYQQVSPKEVPALVEEHLPAPVSLQPNGYHPLPLS